MSTVVVSPHCDDAVFSCGGRLAAASAFRRSHSDQLVVTVCAGIPPAGTPASAWDRRCGFTDAAQAARVRRAEDRAACAELGVTVVQLDFLDHPYQSGKSVEAIAAALAAVLPGDAGLVLGPAGIGRHPDHLRTALAVRRVAAERGIRRAEYADLPYGNGSRRLPVEVLDRKLAAVARYRSQLSALGVYFGPLTERDGRLAAERWTA